MPLILSNEIAQRGTGLVPSTIVSAIVHEVTPGKQAKDGRPKWAIECEIIGPESLDFDGTKVMVGGRRFTLHQVLDQFDPAGLGLLENALRTSGYNFERMGCPKGQSGIDTDRPDALKGHGWDIVVRGKERLALQSLTQKEIEEGKRPYQAAPLLRDGRPIILGYDIDAGIGCTNVVGPCSIPLPPVGF